MKRILLFLTLTPILAFSQSNYNLSLLGTYEWSNTEGSDIWGWVDANGNEFALVGLNDGFSVVDVTNGSSPAEMFFIQDLNSTWRDIKTWGDYAYVTTEADAGLLIVDLTDMTGNTYWHISQFSNPNGNSVEFTAAHNIYIDENGIAYIFGASSNTGSSPSDGVIFLDVDANPTNPAYLGEWDDHYIHDGMARGDTLYAGCIYAGELYVIDVNDKNNPITIGTHPTPSNFTHNAWVSDDGNYVFTTDEVNGGYVGSYDISNITNIQEVDRIQSNPGTNSAPHNTHVDGNFIITSWYRDGTTVHDVTYPNNIIQVAYYDSYSGSGAGFDGCWGTYPFLPSGNIISSDINSSNSGKGRLLVYRSDFTQACYLQGNVTDITNGNPISGVDVTILNTSMLNVSSTNLLGDYVNGAAAANIYDIVFSKSGYLSDTMSATLTSGVVTIVDAQLNPLTPFNANGLINISSGIGVPNAQVVIYNTDFTFSTTTDNNGNFNINGMYEGQYTVVAGQWGYVTSCANIYIDPNTNLTITLDEGYYDDFTFDFGWTVSGGITQNSDGIWERGDPEGTNRQGVLYNPENDINNDCSENAYVTGLLAGSAVGDYDVDDFNTILTSPVFDLSNNVTHYINYYLWFQNDFPWGSAPEDSLTVSISNGVSTVVLQTITANSSNLGQWNYNSFELSQHITLTADMQLIVETADWDGLGGHWVEAGFDKFEITTSPLASINILSEKRNLIKITDLLGREVSTIGKSPLIYIYSDGTVEKRINLSK